MRRTLVAVVSFLIASACAAHADLLVSISKSQQKLAVSVDGEEAYRWPVSTGRRGYTTPSGTFRPERLERHWYSHKYDNAPMPWAVFFHRGYAVHGTMEAYSLGHAASHGCVRLRPDHAATLFSLVRQEGARHTRIVVSDRPLPPLRRTPGDVPVAGTDGAHDTLQARKRRPHEWHRGHPPRAAIEAHAEAAPIRAGEQAWLKRDTEAWLRSLDRKYGIVR